MTDVAIISVLSATAVGTAGIVAGHLSARGNRKHDREARREERRADRQNLVYDQRRVAYVEALAIAMGFRATMRIEGRIVDDPWPGAARESLLRAGAAVYAWGSEPVIDLWVTLLGEALAELTDSVSNEVRDRVVALVDELRTRINAELRALPD